MHQNSWRPRLIVGRGGKPPLQESGVPAQPFGLQASAPWDLLLPAMLIWFRRQWDLQTVTQVKCVRSLKRCLNCAPVTYLWLIKSSHYPTVICIQDYTFTNRSVRVVLFYRAMDFSAKRDLAIAYRLSVRPSVCLSVCLSVCDVGDLWSHRLEILETNCTDY